SLDTNASSSDITVRLIRDRAAPQTEAKIDDEGGFSPDATITGTTASRTGPRAAMLSEGAAAESSASDHQRSMSAARIRLLFPGRNRGPVGWRKMRYNDVVPERLPRIFGDYALLDPLGQGASGDVHLARPLDPNRGIPTPIVIKRLHQKYLEHQEFIRRFRHEAEIAICVDSPHVAKVFAVGAAGDTLFIA